MRRGKCGCRGPLCGSGGARCSLVDRCACGCRRWALWAVLGLLDSDEGPEAVLQRVGLAEGGLKKAEESMACRDVVTWVEDSLGSLPLCPTTPVAPSHLPNLVWCADA